MTAFLSEEWLNELGRLIAEAPSLCDATKDLKDDERFAVAQNITNVPGANRLTNVHYYLLFGPGPARLVAEPVDDALPHVAFTQTYATAVAIATGKRSAQSAFMAGELRVGGRVDLLTANVSILEGIDDVFETLRAKTRW